MLVAVLSDIHSNAAALDAVLDAVSALRPAMGHRRHRRLRPRPGRGDGTPRSEGAIAVQGNHDAAALGRIPTSSFNVMARAAVEWTATVISPSTRAWLSALPERRVEGDFTLVHGSPRDPLWEYLFAVPEARLNLGAFETRYCLVGHTHHQLTFRDDGGHVESLPTVDGTRLVLDERRYILNAGSVGQPRDGDPRACAMLLDTESGEVEWRRIAYAVARTQHALWDLPLPESLAARLARGT